MSKTINKSIKDNIIGKNCIIRTKDAGVWYGVPADMDNEAVMVKQARRMYFWKCLDDGITLSHVVINGIHPDSKIQAPVDLIMLQWIEVSPLSAGASATFDSQGYARAE